MNCLVNTANQKGGLGVQNAAYSEKLSGGNCPRKVSLFFDVRVVVADPVGAWKKYDQVPVVQLLNASFCDGFCASAFYACG
jgi:hypothetical protein